MERTILAAALVACALSAQTITTLIGNGKPGFSANSVNNPYGLLIGPDGALYFCDIDNHAIRRLDLKTTNVTTVVGHRGEREFRRWRASDSRAGRSALRNSIR